MSVAKVTVVQKARQDQGECGRCGKPLPAGSGYLWWTVGFRSSYKHKRCLREECYPRPSERESSKAASVLAAQEDFAAQVWSLWTVDDIEAAVADVAQAVVDLRDEYDEALQSWEYGNEQLQEKYDHYDSQSYEIEGWSWDGTYDWERCEEHDEADAEVDEDGTPECEACAESREAWINEVREAASEVVDAVETL